MIARSLIIASLLLAMVIATCADEPQTAVPLPEHTPAAAVQPNGSILQLHDGTFAAVANEQWIPGEEPPSYFGRLKVGRGYFDVLPQGEEANARTGLTYGGDLLKHLTGGLFAYGAASANHFSQGSQFLGTLGVLALPTGNSPYVVERCGGSVLFDYFSDSRFDGYLSQLRLSVDYAIRPGLQASVQYTEPLHNERVDLALVAGANPVSTTMQSTRGVELMVAQSSRACTVSAGVGYRDVFDCVSYQAGINIPTRKHCQLFCNVLYLERGIWVNTMGLQIAFGGLRGPRHGEPGSGWATDASNWLENHSVPAPWFWGTTAVGGR